MTLLGKKIEICFRGGRVHGSYTVAGDILTVTSKRGERRSAVLAEGSDVILAKNLLTELRSAEPR